MSTTAPSAPSATDPGQHREAHTSSGLRPWRASWRVALRMARRDIRRYRGRSLVVALMVAIPVALLTFAVFETARSLDPQRDVRNRLGSASAWVGWPGQGTLVQDGTGTVTSAAGTDPPPSARPVPGFDPSASGAVNAAAIGALTGGTATPTTSTEVVVPIGDRNVRMTVLVIDGRVGFGPKAELLRGSWPSRPGEAVVTPPGIRKGLPESGTFVISVDGHDTTMTVTGVGTGTTEWGQVPHLITPADPTDGGVGAATGEAVGPVDGEAGWLITGTDMPYAKVAKLSAYGIQVTSAELVRDPVPADQLPSELRDLRGGTESAALPLVAGGAMLAVVITLLVAPAFAVSAARQRRTLALAASNGARSGQLRHTVLARALVLGVLSALLGAGLGALASWALWRWAMTHGTDVWASRFVVPWSALLGIVGCAVVSALVAALVPARRLDRLDILGVLKGQNVSPPISRVTPVVGLLVSALGAVVLWSSTTSGLGDTFVTLGTVALILGALGCVPAVLVGLARIASRFPVALRMATRDSARQRARSVPTVAAVLAAVAALTTIAIASASDNEQQRREYQPATIPGEAVLQVAGDPAVREDAIRVIRRDLPGAVITETARVDGDTIMTGAGDDASSRFVSVVRPGCTPEQSVFDAAFVRSQQNAAPPAPAPPPAPESTDSPERSPCESIGYAWSSGPAGIGVLPAEVVIDRFDLSGSAAAAVRAGGVVIADTAIDADSRDVTLAWGTRRTDPENGDGPDISIVGTTRVPALVVPWNVDTAPRMLGENRMLVTPQLAAAHDWPTAPGPTLVDDPDGTISPEAEQRIQEALGGDAAFTVERGFDNIHSRVMAIVLGAFGLILLVVTLTSTALSMAESARDDATLAAIGATRRTRRTIAAAQSFVIAGLGAVLGWVVGVLPGISFAHNLTRDSYDPLTSTMTQGPGILLIPWGWLAAAVVGVPVLAALLSAVAVRRAPVVTRRLG